MSARTASNPGDAVAAAVGAATGAFVGTVVGSVVFAAPVCPDDAAVAAVPERMLNVVVVVTSASIASMFTMYSSALKVEASTSSAQLL